MEWSNGYKIVRCLDNRFFSLYHRGYRYTMHEVENILPEEEIVEYFIDNITKHSVRQGPLVVYAFGDDAISDFDCLLNRESKENIALFSCQYQPSKEVKIWLNRGPRGYHGEIVSFYNSLHIDELRNLYPSAQLASAVKLVKRIK